MPPSIEFREEGSAETAPVDIAVGLIRPLRRPSPSALRVPHTYRYEDEVQVFLATLRKSSSFVRLSRTNDVPSEVEEAQLRTMLVVGRRHLSELDEDSIDVRGSQKKAADGLLLRRVVNKLVSILSPFRRLPFEIISQIVLHALGPNYTSSPIRCGGKSDTPWKFTRISHLWRAALVSMPVLWSNWDFDVPNLRSWTGFDALCNLLVQRSKSAPLTISIEENIIDTNWMSTIIRECHRWKVAKFYCFQSDSLSALQAVRGDIGQLESLELFFNINLQQSRDPIIFGAFEVAPRLRDLTLDMQHAYVDVVLPWAQLRRLAMPESNMSVSDSLKLMRKLPHDLVELSLPEVNRAGEGLHPDPILQLDHLRSLRIPRDHGHLAPGILDFLKLPALESFIADSISGPAPSFHHLFGRSGCSLTSLSIYSLYDYESLVDTLRLIPTLTDFMLDQAEYDLNLIPSLIVRSSEDPLLPRLKSFKIFMELEITYYVQYSEVMPHFDDADLAEMVESRNKVASAGLVAQLETFHFEFYWKMHGCDLDEDLTGYHLSPQVVERFKSLEAGGLSDIYVQVGGESYISSDSSHDAH